MKLSSPSHDTAAVREIEDVWEAYVRAHDAGDARGVSDWLTEDALVLTPGLPEVVGREGFRDLVARSFATATFEDLRVVSRELEVYGDRAYQLVDFAETMIVDGKDPKRLKGRCMVQWSREPDGWRIRRYISNAAPKE